MRHAESVPGPERAKVEDLPSPLPVTCPAQVPTPATRETAPIPTADTTPNARAQDPLAAPAQEQGSTAPSTAAASESFAKAEKQPLWRSTRAPKPPDRFQPEDFKKLTVWCKTGGIFYRADKAIGLITKVPLDRDVIPALHKMLHS